MCVGTISTAQLDIFLRKRKSFRTITASSTVSLLTTVNIFAVLVPPKSRTPKHRIPGIKIAPNIVVVGGFSKASSPE